MFRPARDQHQGIKQSKTAQTQISHFCIEMTSCKIARCLKCTYLFVELFHKCERFCYTVCWQKPTYLTIVSTVPYCTESDIVRHLYGYSSYSVFGITLLFRVIWVSCEITITARGTPVL